MKIFIILLILLSLIGCTDTVLNETRKQGSKTSHFFTEHCVDGVSYIVYYGGYAMSVKYDKVTQLPERCEE